MQYVKHYKFQDIPKRNAKKCLCNYKILFLILCCFISLTAVAQVKSSVDINAIRIGEQITYKIEVEANSNALVVFPEGQTFEPLEMLETYNIDTVKNNTKYNLLRRYGLTQFDSGYYTIPKQKIIIDDKTFFTNSIDIRVSDVIIDSTKQELYDIKPIVEVDKITNGATWLKYLLYVLGSIAVVVALLYWFLWRKKPLTEAQKIALLPPYERAKVALKKLDETNYLEQENLKDYYSELTFIIRKYLDEKVFDKALESTTDQLIEGLKELRKSNQIDLSSDDVTNIEAILKRADLVKFAKSAPDTNLAKLDRDTIDLEIDHVKQALPEPTEEEKLLDEKYKAEQERREKQKKLWITVAVSVFLLMATVVGFSLKYGFEYVKDTVIGHTSKELLEGEWYTSQYGVPAITISTPKVLKRMPDKLPEQAKQQMEVAMFGYGSLIDRFNIIVLTTKIKNLGENKIKLEQVVEQGMQMLVSQGVEDIVTKTEAFITPNRAEGLKAYGTASFPGAQQDKKASANYTLLVFNTGNTVQQVVLKWDKNDSYAAKIVDRILNSIETKYEEE